MSKESNNDEIDPVKEINLEQFKQDIIAIALNQFNNVLNSNEFKNTFKQCIKDTIKDVQIQNAVITNVPVKNAIITNVPVQNAVIEQVKVKDAVIEKVTVKVEIPELVPVKKSYEVPEFIPVKIDKPEYQKQVINVPEINYIKRDIIDPVLREQVIKIKKLILQDGREIE
jgi:D-mannonate dehydratase